MIISEKEWKMCREHEIRVKVKLGFTLSQREESYYLLYMAGHDERLNYVRQKKAKARQSVEREKGLWTGKS